MHVRVRSAFFQFGPNFSVSMVQFWNNDRSEAVFWSMTTPKSVLRFPLLTCWKSLQSCLSFEHDAQSRIGRQLKNTYLGVADVQEGVRWMPCQYQA
mmetsp:Transcript_18583/g.46021  ORF Transcript_18583/g.46021 Transcript_18583/m.46021 type:complete len:96 (+) Transcript_18583:125-412(+)